jgi:hypothetical protein
MNGFKIVASKEVHLEVNTEKTKYTLLPHYQIAGQNHAINLSDRSTENVAQFKYLGTTVTNQNFIQEEIKRRLNLGNACYHSVQIILSSPLLSKNLLHWTDLVQDRNQWMALVNMVMNLWVL